MSRAKFASASAFTPGKIILIGVLGVVLLIVVVMQIPSSSSKSTKANKRARRSSSSSQEKSKAPARSGQAKPAESVQPATTVWPQYSSEAVLAHNPFAIPGWTGAAEHKGDSDVMETADEELQADQDAARITLEDIQSSGVSMIMISENERVAKIGEAELHEGDAIGGFIVKEINTDGVVLIEDQAP